MATHSSVLARAWWAAVYGVAQSWTRLRRLSSSSSRVLPGGDVIIQPRWSPMRRILEVERTYGLASPLL